MRKLLTIFVIFWVNSAYSEVYIKASRLPIIKDGQEIKKVNTVRLLGQISEEDYRKLDKILKSSEVDPNLDTLFLVNSGGGDVEAAAALIKTIKMFNMKQMKKKKFVAAYVDEGALCASLCTLIIMYFPNRIVAPNARFGYHGAYDIFLDHSKKHTQDLIKWYRTAANETQNPNFLLWLNSNLKMFDTIDFQWFTGNELYEKNTGTLTSKPIATQDQLNDYLNSLGN